MLTVASVIRKTPVSTLRTYFDARRIDLSGSINWQDARLPTAQRLIKAVENVNRDDYAVIVMDFDRIHEMTDEAGQGSIAGVIQDPNVLHSLSNGHDRAMWLYLHDEASFRRAEEVRFAEHYRRGQRWACFAGPKDKEVFDDDERRNELVARICSMFKSMNALLEVYQRQQVGSNKSVSLITQVVIYREGFPDGFWEFENGAMELKPVRPVLEAVLTYNAKSGDIEVVGLDSQDKPRLARLFSDVMLGQGIIGMRVPLRQYDLSSLAVQRTFQTDREDGIAAVKVRNLHIQPKEYPGLLLALKEKPDTKKSLYEYFNDPARGPNPLQQEGVQIVQADFSIRFRSDRENSRGKTIAVRVALPNECDLKGRTEKERLICEKYLLLWGLVKEV